MNQFFIFFNTKRGWDKSPSLSIIFGLSSKTQGLSGLYYADFISFYSPTQLCGGGTTKSNSNELPISVPLSFLVYFKWQYLKSSFLIWSQFFRASGGKTMSCWRNIVVISRFKDSMGRAMVTELFALWILSMQYSI